MWTLIIKLAVRFGKTEWAKGFARATIERLRREMEVRLKGIADAADIKLPPPPAMRSGRLVSMRTDSLKPGQQILLDNQKLRITRLISHSVNETIYEADIVG